MPTYTYACTECGHEFDIRQSFTDDPLTDCPDCADGAGRLRKVIHPVGIAFKGSGFYKTDSRAAAKTASAAGAGNGSGDTKKDSGSTTSSDSTTVSLRYERYRYRKHSKSDRLDKSRSDVRPI